MVQVPRSPNLCRGNAYQFGILGSRDELKLLYDGVLLQQRDICYPLCSFLNANGVEEVKTLIIHLNLSVLLFMAMRVMTSNYTFHHAHRQHQQAGIMIRITVCLSLLATFSIVSASTIPSSGNLQQPVIESAYGGQTHLQDHLGAVASESSICSRIGIDLLKEGGNAADALVGTVFCVGVIGMYHSGIGGGGFMLVRGSDGRYEDIDFRETAPAAYYQDMYNKDPVKSVFGGLAR